MNEPYDQDTDVGAIGWDVFESNTITTTTVQGTMTDPTTGETVPMTVIHKFEAPNPDPGKIRVLRVIEYHYKDVAAYLDDRMDWTEHSPQSGRNHPGWGLDMSMYSAVVSVHMTNKKGDWEQYAGLPAEKE